MIRRARVVMPPLNPLPPTSAVWRTKMDNRSLALQLPLPYRDDALYASQLAAITKVLMPSPAVLSAEGNVVIASPSVGVPVIPLLRMIADYLEEPFRCAVRTVMEAVDGTSKTE